MFSGSLAADSDFSIEGMLGGPDHIHEAVDLLSKLPMHNAAAVLALANYHQPTPGVETLAQFQDSMSAKEFSDILVQFSRDSRGYATTFSRLAMNVLTGRARAIRSDPTMGKEEKDAFMQQLTDTEVVIADPISFILRHAKVLSLTQTGDAINCYDYATRFRAQETLNSAAFFVPPSYFGRAQIMIPAAPYSTEAFLQYFTHETEHSTSSLGDDYVGLEEYEYSDTGQKAILNTAVYEGWNDRKTLITRGYSPDDVNCSSYRGELVIVNKLVRETGEKVWRDADSPLNSVDRTRRAEMKQRLMQALDNAYGCDGFLNRLNCNMALYGIEFGFDVTANHAYEPIDYPSFDIFELPARYDALNPLTIPRSYMNGKRVAPKRGARAN